MAWLGSWESFVKVVRKAGSRPPRHGGLDCTRAQVSKQIGDLERAFGVRLFERSPRKLNPDAIGRGFHQHALRALEAIHGARSRRQEHGRRAARVLRISARSPSGACIARCCRGSSPAIPS